MELPAQQTQAVAVAVEDLNMAATADLALSLFDTH
jgi:hypothetical protein